MVGWRHVGVEGLMGVDGQDKERDKPRGGKKVAMWHGGGKGGGRVGQGKG